MTSSHRLKSGASNGGNTMDIKEKLKDIIQEAKGYIDTEGVEMLEESIKERFFTEFKNMTHSRDQREKEEGWPGHKKGLFVLSPEEINILSHLLSEEIIRVTNSDDVAISYKNFIMCTKGHILKGGERID